MNNLYDVVYHGYDYDPDSTKFEKEFREEIKKVFPEVELKDAYDDIKGHRTIVTATNIDTNTYYAFLFAFGFAGGSLSVLTSELDEEAILNIIKEKWPEQIKIEE